MKTIFLILLIGVLGVIGAHATNRYVSAPTNVPAGSDTNPGTLAMPYATLQKAANVVQAGDTVFVRGGTYTNACAQCNVVVIDRPGTASQWIVFKNYPGEHPLLKFNAWGGFLVKPGCAYLEINGFRLQGDNANQTVAAAETQNRSCDDNDSIRAGAYEARFNCNGIAVDGRNPGAAARPHHFRIVNNEIFECGGAGVGAIQSDYVTVANNLIYDNCWYTIFGTSGISLYQNWNYDTAPGYHMVVRDNRCFGNRLYVKWAAVCAITDGNGIIIDDSRNTQNGSTLGDYLSRTLVANNLVVNNGGGGLVVYESDHVDVINNTAYFNSQSPELAGGDIKTTYCRDVLVQNNITVAAAGKSRNSINNSTNVTYNANLFFGGTGVISRFNNTNFVNTNLRQVDPQFKNPTTDWSTANFRLQPNSLAIDAGVAPGAPATDAEGHPRPQGAGYDLGAYEFSAPLPVELTAFSAEARGGVAYLTWTTASEKANAGFVVEVSATGLTFSPLGWVAGHGTGSNVTNYYFTDVALAGYPSPAVYYRLRQLDIDGTTSFSPVRVVKVSLALTLALWPNPAHRGVTVTGGLPGRHVQILDASGRVQLTTTMPATGPLQLALPDLAPGLYVVRSDGQSYRFAIE